MVPLDLYTGSISVFASVAGLESTTDKRLLIELCMQRRRYELRKLTEIVRILDA